MNMSDKNSERALTAAIERYNDVWNAHDVDAIIAMHAPGMVFDNHTAGESASGAYVRAHIAAIFETWPDSVSILRQVGLLD
jgi:ketosteroid isomerase-like protein